MSDQTNESYTPAAPHSDTPRTDAEAKWLLDIDPANKTVYNVVGVKFAHTLERELAAAVAERDEARRKATALNGARNQMANAFNASDANAFWAADERFNHLVEEWTPTLAMALAERDKWHSEYDRTAAYRDEMEIERDTAIARTETAEREIAQLKRTGRELLKGGDAYEPKRSNAEAGIANSVNDVAKTGPAIAAPTSDPEARQTDTPSAEIKPCPFFGHTSAPSLSDNEEMGLEYVCPAWLVCCDACEGGCGATSGYKETQQKAVEWWNRRTLECELAAVTEERDGANTARIRNYETMAAQQREIARLKEDREFERGCITQLKTDNDTLASKVGEAHKDTERLDWLATNSEFERGDIHYRWVKFRWFYFAQNIRAAIDAARKEQP